MEAQINQDSIQLFNGEPIIRVTKTIVGNYEWSTIASGMMGHSLLEEVVAYMKRNNYEFYIVNQKDRYNYEA